MVLWQKRKHTLLCVISLLILPSFMIYRGLLSHSSIVTRTSQSGVEVAREGGEAQRGASGPGRAEGARNTSKAESYRWRTPEAYSKRRSAVHKQCTVRTRRNKTAKPLSHHKLSNLLVDDEAQLIYCIIPKVACSHWMLAMIINKHPELAYAMNRTANKSINVHQPGVKEKYGLRMLSSYKKDEIKYKLDNYYKFMFVRDPYTRLLSAYRNKINPANTPERIHFQRRYGARILKRYRKNISDSKAGLGQGVEFVEFLQYVSDNLKSGIPLNPHWDSYEHLCHPCHIQYDFIGKLDSPHNTEANELIKIIGADSSVGLFPNRYKYTNTTLEMQTIYRTIPQWVIDHVKYAYRFDLFGFEYDINAVSGF